MENEQYDPCEAISRVSVEKMAACGLVLEAGGWLVYRAVSGEEGLWEDGWPRLLLPTTLGRVFLGMWQDVIHNSLTPCDRGSLLLPLGPPPLNQEGAVPFSRVHSTDFPCKGLSGWWRQGWPRLKGFIPNRRPVVGRRKQEYLSEVGELLVHSIPPSTEVLLSWSRKSPFPPLPPQRLK